MAKPKLVHAFRGSAAELRDSLLEELKRMEDRMPAGTSSSYADGVQNGEKMGLRDIIHFIRKIAILDDTVSMNVAKEDVAEESK